MSYQATLQALSDPTRRRIYERLRQRPHNVGELARLSRVTQPAVSQHLRVLRKARLVTDTRDGTRRNYRASETGLAELRQYLDNLWGDILGAYAAADPSPRSKAAR